MPEGVLRLSRLGLQSVEVSYVHGQHSGARMAAGGDPVGHGSQPLLAPGAEHQSGATARQLHGKGCSKAGTG